MRKLSVPLIGQLTYTSWESPSGQGGWQVKEVRGLPPDWALTVETLAPTDLPHPYVADLRFVPESQVRLWPRRLAYRELPGAPGYFVVLHSVPAGMDRSGRPGNVFTHGAVVDPGALPTSPIVTWRSESWLAPFGPEGVDAARLHRDTLEAPDLTDALNEFLRGGEVWRPGVLGVMLDALRARRRGGPSLVVVCHDTDDAASWLQCLVAAASPRTAARLAFSTLEPKGGEGRGSGSLFDVVCVLRDEVQPESLRDSYVIDTAEDPTLGVRGGEPHATGLGLPIPASLWSELFIEAYSVADDVGPLQTRLGELSARIPGLDAADPAWWLVADAVLSGSVDIDAEGQQIMATSAPDGVEAAPDVAAAVVAALVGVLGDATQERWDALAHMRGASPYVRRLATTAYLLSALDDPAWWAQNPEAVPEAGIEPHLSPELVAALERFVASDAVQGVDAAVSGVCLYHVIDAAGWGNQPEAMSARERVGEQWIAQTMLDPAEAQALFGRVKPANSAVRELLTEQLLSAVRRESIIPKATIRNLRLLTLEVFESTLIIDGDGTITPLGVSLVVAALSDTQSRALTDSVLTCALRALLQLPGGHPARASILKGLLDVAVPVRLLEQLGADNVMRLPAILVQKVLMEHDPEEVAPLAQALSEAPAARALASLTGTVAWASFRTLREVYRTLSRARAEIVQQRPDWQPHSSVTAMLALFLVVELMGDPTRARDVALPEVPQEAVKATAARMVRITVQASTAGLKANYPRLVPPGNTALCWAAMLLFGAEEVRFPESVAVLESRSVRPLALELLGAVVATMDQATFEGELPRVAQWVRPKEGARGAERVLGDWAGGYRGARPGFFSRLGFGKQKES